jgi:hypothetical protein
MKIEIHIKDIDRENYGLIFPNQPKSKKVGPENN